MPSYRINLADYFDTHGRFPRDDQFGTWYLVRSSGNGFLEISRTCYWRDLKHVRFDFAWALKP